jgi:transmembrane sensor
MKEDDDRSLSEEDRIEKEAADWVAYFDRGLTAREQDAFFEWLAENPRHGEVFAQDQEQWQEFNLLDQWCPEYSKEANPDLLKKAFHVSFWKSKTSLYVAAAILLIGLFTPLLLHLDLRNESKFLAEGDFAPSYERHVLEDGSTVELNVGAQVEVFFTENERRVKLTAGEAHFSVTKNPERPFIVDVKGAEVRAIGTAFDFGIPRSPRY